MGFISEFKEFAMKGNVVDLAIGVIIGGAFGKIVSSLIDDVITPMLLNPALKAAGAEDIAQLKIGAVKYGSFLSNIISFLIIAIVMFIIIKAINASKKKEEIVTVTLEPSETEKLLAKILETLEKK